MRIATFAPYAPYPGVPHAGGQFLLNWARSLTRHGAEVTIVTPRQSDVGIACPPVDSEPFSLLEVPLAGSRNTRRVGNGLSIPFLTPGWGVKRAFSEDPRVKDLLSSVDVVEVQWSHFLPLTAIAKSHRKPVFAVEHDVVSDSVARRVVSANRLRDRLIAAAKLPGYRLMESRLLNTCAGVLSFSERDVCLLERLGVRAPVRTIPPWIEAVPAPQGPSGGATILMVGAFHRPENSEGARWFLRHCWPRLRDRFPEAVLIFAGSRPPQDLEGPGVVTTGWVDDLAPWYGRARVVVAPLLSGAGLKFKVAQAMRHELPVVGTPIAADGYRELGGDAAFAAVTSDPVAFADAVSLCLEDKGQAARLGRRGAEWIERTFDWDLSVVQILDWYGTHTGASAC